MTDEETFAALGSNLAAAVRDALPAWVERAFRSRTTVADEQTVADLKSAQRRASTDVGDRLDELVALDLDDQWTNPLSIIRSAAVYPTELLRSLGVPEVHRDTHAQRLHTDDVYDLAPAAFADLSPEVHNSGLLWGAAKAHLHLTRRKGDPSAPIGES